MNFHQSLPPDLTVAPLTAADLPQIISLNAETAASAWNDQQFLEELNYRDAKNGGLYDYDGRLTGFILVRLIMNQNNTFEVALLLIAVKPNRQNQGGANLLLRMMIKNIGAERISRITLEVRSKNVKAINFYRKFGFITEAERKSYYAAPSDGALLMSLVVSKAKFE